MCWSKARRSGRWITFLASALPALWAGSGWAWLPGTGSPDAVSGFVVDSTSRIDVLACYHTVYTASQNYAANMSWTGNVASGLAGTTAAAFKDDVRRRINFYRALASLPADIVFDATKAGKCQEAALVFSANNDLSHDLDGTWAFYTPAAGEAAANSNIALGAYGPPAIDGFMRDSGAGNAAVGHRRWFLYSRAQQMATGDIPPNGSYNSANAVWVLTDFKPAPAPQFVAWPNRGYTPHDLVPSRWSLSYPGANFSSATVTMTQGGSPVSTSIISNADSGYGDNSIVWVPAGVPSSVTSDVTYQVSVTGISGSGVPSSYSYAVTVFDPGNLNDSVVISGSSTPYTTGSSYTFNGIAQADQYELRVSTASAAGWTEGAEDTPAPQIIEGISPGYTLRQTSLKRTGAKAFQVTYPAGVFNDQHFQIARDIIPSGSSQLQFYDRARFSTTTTTLNAEISTDGGSSWTGVFSRNGVGLSSANWDANWISRSVSLAAYAGQTVRIRFIMRRNGGSVTQGTTSSHGFFVDDISVTDATELVNPTTTSLAGSATSFQLDAATAGAPLAAGATYFMRIRPNVGTRWFGFGAAKMAAAQPPAGYAGWIATQFPWVTGGTTADHDRDGITNGMEYAFGLDPTTADPATAVPQPVGGGGALTLSYASPAAMSGVTYGAEWSSNLAAWTPITDTGSGNVHTFTVSLAGHPLLFIRHRIVVVE